MSICYYIADSGLVYFDSFNLKEADSEIKLKEQTTIVHRKIQLLIELQKDIHGNKTYAQNFYLVKFHSKFFEI